MLSTFEVLYKQRETNSPHKLLFVGIVEVSLKTYLLDTFSKIQDHKKSWKSSHASFLIVVLAPSLL